MRSWAQTVYSLTWMRFDGMNLKTSVNSFLDHMLASQCSLGVQLPVLEVFVVEIAEGFQV